MEFINDYYIKGYLSNSLTSEEKQAFEQALKEQPMLRDVIEGLRPLSTLEIELHIKELQKALNHHIDQQKVKRKPSALSFTQQWIWIITAFFILMIIIVGMYLIFTL